MTRVVVTAFGPDRPGIVAAVTGALVERGANLADTAMTNLAGQFAMVLVVEVPEGEQADALEEALAARTAPLGLTVVVRPLPEGDDATTGPQTDGRSAWAVSVYGADRPGIVHQVSALLAQHGANVVDLTTRTVGSTGAPAYVMLLEVTLPADRDVEPLASDLRRLSADLDVEIHLRPDDADVL
ncbi:MAG: Formyltetrahydrofolate deformylase [uncultured Acidimicrobiales bacterium]|uniref:Formyltetrahydrofolate deformylase n=1 Tax=uncultured Acidimicrobiales bacterium TaxID=310071 RepID=A0A6J4HNJ4_9ACTN|nr:MAG: Formyltetrahydrofolate deformylase [uncultured Acidimicrobiales bacterium]